MRGRSPSLGQMSSIPAIVTATLNKLMSNSQIMVDALLQGRNGLRTPNVSCSCIACIRAFGLDYRPGRSARYTTHASVGVESRLR